MSGFELFMKGGPVMYLLLACSLITVGVAIERVLYYRQIQKQNMQDFLTNFGESLNQNNRDVTEEFLKNQSGLLSDIAYNAFQGLMRDEEVSIVLDTEFSYWSTKLKDNLRYLSAVVTVAPLLGLLGTIVGMMNSFSIFSVQSGQPMAITGGIGEALIATATGLLVAVIAFLFFLLLSKWQEDLTIELERTLGFMEVKLCKLQRRG